MPPSHAAARAAVVAQRHATAANPQHPAVWQPWDTLLKAAEGQLKSETGAALAELQRRMAEATQLLNVAYATAASPAADLRSAAWAAWHQYMGMADDLLSAVLSPATKAYDAEVAAAGHAYDAALADAVKAYTAALDRARRAKSDAGNLPKAV